MSWLSNKTGRPQEEGGHYRLNISVDSHTRDLILSTDNHSNFIEHSIAEAVKPKLEDSDREKIEICSSSRRFVTAATFELSPQLSSGNAILEANCLFDYFSEKGPFACRVTVNGKKGLTLKRERNNSYTCSYISNGEMGFNNMPALFHNSNSYIFCFQTRSVGSVPIYVKNVRFIVKFIEHPKLENWNVYDTIWQKNEGGTLSRSV